MVLQIVKIRSLSGAVNYFTRYYAGKPGKPPDFDPDAPGMVPHASGIRIWSTPAYEEDLDPVEREVDPIDLPGEPDGHWYGPATSHLIEGVVRPTHLSRLLRGVHPRTKEPLVQNACVKPGRKKKNARHRVSGWDMTFSAPKAVSVLWALGSPGLRQAIEAIHDRAVEKTLDLASKQIFTRIGKNGVTKSLAEPIFAVFQHSTSREGDPNIHSHALLINAARSMDGVFRAIHSPILFDQMMVLGAAYRQELAYALRTDLGILTERTGRSFTVSGIPDELLWHFSKRRQQIVEELDRLGLSSMKSAKNVAVATRKSKTDEALTRTRRENLESWQAEGRQFGVDSDSLDALRQEAIASAPPPNPTDIVNAAIENLLVDRTHFSRKEFLCEVLYIASEYNVSPADLIADATYQLENRPDIKLLVTENGWERFTTQSQLDAEKQLLALADKLHYSPGLVASDRTIAKVLASRKTIRPDQREALIHLAQSRGRLQILNGPAGAGKTFLMRAVVEAFKGKRVIGLAFTKNAARKMAEAGISETYTLTRFLGDFGQDISIADHAKHTLRQLARAAQKKKTYRLSRPRPMPIDKNTVVIVDEASMQGMKYSTLLFDHVHRSGATLRLVGDPYQIPPVADQAVYQSLCERYNAGSLTEVTRQDEDWAKEVVKHLMNGNVEPAITEYERRGRIHPSDFPLDSLVWDWWHLAAAKSPENTFILTAMNVDVERLNDLCQETMLRNGRLSGAPIRISDTCEGRVYKAETYIGDCVAFSRNSSEYNDGFLVENGTRGTVIDTDPDSETITVELCGLDRRVIKVRPQSFPHIRRGYAGTTHKAQGGTIPKTFVLLTEKMQDLPTTYVQMSRHKADCHLYLATKLWEKDQSGKRPIVEHMKRRPDLRLASDILLKLERAKAAGVPDHVYADSELVYVRHDQREHFTWEPARVQSQGMDLCVRLITEHTQEHITLHNTQFNDHLRRELPPELRQQLEKETQTYARALDFAMRPIQKGDAVWYLQDSKDAPPQYVKAEVVVDFGDGTLAIDFGDGTGRHYLGYYEVVERLRRHDAVLPANAQTSAADRRPAQKRAARRKAKVADKKRPLSKAEFVAALSKVEPQSLITCVEPNRVGVKRALLTKLVGREYPNELPRMEYEELPPAHADYIRQCRAANQRTVSAEASAQAEPFFARYSVGKRVTAYVEETFGRGLVFWDGEVIATSSEKVTIRFENGKVFDCSVAECERDILPIEDLPEEYRHLSASERSFQFLTPPERETPVSEPEPVREPEPKKAHKRREYDEPFVYTPPPLDTSLSKPLPTYLENTLYPAAAPAQMPGCPTPGAAEMQIWTTSQQTLRPLPVPLVEMSSHKTVDSYFLLGPPQKQAN